MTKAGVKHRDISCTCYNRVDLKKKGNEWDNCREGQERRTLPTQQKPRIKAYLWFKN